MYDIIVIGAGAAGASFALKMAKYAKVLLVEANNENYFPKGTKVFPQHNHPFISEIEWENREILFSDTTKWSDERTRQYVNG